MIERKDNQEQISLFDEIPQELKQREKNIRQTFDGTLGIQGISMVLNPLTKAVIRARLVDLKTGRITSYEPLARGKWANLVGDLVEGSLAYKKLDRVYEDVRDKLILWKNAHPGYGPMREWTTIKGKRIENPFDSEIILPEEWFEKVSINLISNSAKILEEKQEDFEEKKPRVRTTDKRLPKPRTGRVKRISSKDEKDAKPAPTNHRRNADRAIQKARGTI